MTKGMEQWRKDLWIKTLLGDEYKRGRAWLARSEDKEDFRYCCLGVLCAVSPDIRFLTRKLEGKEQYKYLAYKADGQAYKADGFLTTYVLNKVGLTDKQQHDLASLNDGGSTFKDIATYIKEEISVREA